MQKLCKAKVEAGIEPSPNVPERSRYLTSLLYEIDSSIADLIPIRSFGHGIGSWDSGAAISCLKIHTGIWNLESTLSIACKGWNTKLVTGYRKSSASSPKYNDTPTLGSAAGNGINCAWNLIYGSCELHNPLKMELYPWIGDSIFEHI